ncbi:DUF2513 domain-containing protein [Ruminococcus sp.]|uniref:DUF2513 domain-containing protein n=1 Tax=Ruminococcus sp. TaxID=41978 RepID=UPI003966AA4C
MKLNYDCVRELLLTLEENLVMDDSLSYPSLTLKQVCEKMPDFSRADIAYASTKLLEAEYIEANSIESDSKIIKIVYSSITYEGHQYLDSIRDSKLWSTVKKNAKALTFELVKKLAEIYVVNQFTP